MFLPIDTSPDDILYHECVFSGGKGHKDKIYLGRSTNQHSGRDCGIGGAGGDDQVIYREFHTAL